jgi:hypothetical protein
MSLVIREHDISAIFAMFLSETEPVRCLFPLAPKGDIGLFVLQHGAQHPSASYVVATDHIEL